MTDMKRIEGKGFTIEYDESRYRLSIDSGEPYVISMCLVLKRPWIQDFFDEAQKYPEISAEGESE